MYNVLLDHKFLNEIKTMKKICPFGTHRVIEPVGALPQNASRLDNSLPLQENELLINVDTLNIDSASFHQMLEQANGDAAEVGRIVKSTVKKRGKQHNEVTGSGGMLLGTIAQSGPLFPGHSALQPGLRIATLVSLTLTPLSLSEIVDVHPSRDQVEVHGHGILFPSGSYAFIPSDLPETLSLAALDVCGAPAHMARFVKPGMTVVVMGAAGKSGFLCCAAIREILGDSGQLVGVEFKHGPALKSLESLGLCNNIILADATSSVEVYERVNEVTHGDLADLVVNLTNVPNTEMSCILSAKARGTVFFFSMATSFSKAALGAEGVSCDANLVIGNGFIPGAAEFTLDLIRRNAGLRAYMQSQYSLSTNTA